VLLWAAIQTKLTYLPRPRSPTRCLNRFEAVPDPYARVEYALSLGEAAARLGVSHGELERMIAAGNVEALPTGFTRMIPRREIERLRRRR
jgi:excisionase family DNA binding protein